MAADLERQASDFWSFGLALYDRSAPLCLELQDRGGRDVNLLLLCCWCGMVRGLALQAADLAALEAALEPWRSEVVQPLRAVRRFLKGDSLAAGLREQVKAAELAAERVAQRRLLAALPDKMLTTPSPALGLANLERYVGPEAARAFMACCAEDAAPRPSA